MDKYYRLREDIIGKKFRVTKTPRRPRVMNGTVAMEGPNRFKWVCYIPTCRYGAEDCVCDPAYIHATYPNWYVKLYGESNVMQVARMDSTCSRCVNGDRYDDEDK